MNKICLTIICFALAGCSQNNDIDTAVLPNDNISFVVDVEAQTKGSMVNQEEQMGSLGLYCAYTEDVKWSTTTIFDKMVNQRLDYSDELTDWLYYSNAPTWDYASIVDRYTFMAYSPYGDDYNGISTSIQSGDLVVSYAVPTDYRDQPDLMMAIPCKDIYPLVTRLVPLDFKHALASIGFSVKGSSSEVITEVVIKNIVDRGSVTISDSGEFLWSLDPISQLTYSAGIESGVELDAYTSQGITLDDGYLMMIPQECDKIEIEVVIYSAKNRDYTTKTFSLDCDDSWEAGEVYDYTINISDYDYTIEGTSNCYMLHPNGEEQIFYIPVEGRINTFWRDYADDNQTYEDMLSSDDVWDARILWNDFRGNTNSFKVERVTSGFSPSESVTPFCEPDFTTIGTQSAMKITLPANMTEGNILVAVEFEGQILWSWHLWVTEYNPDQIAAQNSARRNKYTYTVNGVEGEVHRYESDDLWSTLYDDSFIMDRNLGALSCDYEPSRYGVLHYQFGRKDPFPAVSSISTTIENACVSFSESVQNPTTFYTRKDKPYSWSEEGLNISSDYLWFDKTIYNSSDASGKSIFDPSPLGWQVPRYGTFTVMSSTNCEYVSNDNILIYNDIATLPMTGYRSNNSGAVNSYGDQGNLRLSTQIDSSSAYNLAYNPYIDEDTNNTLSDGFCVRCIQE